MSIALLNGISCIRCDTRLARQGVWTADCVVDTPDKVEGPVRLELARGALVLRGTVVPSRTGVFAESAVVRVLGGAGRMAEEVPPKFFRGATVRIIADAILSAVGEQLSPTSSPKVTGRQLDGYAHIRQPAAAALSLLCGRVGAIWRVLPDGTVWIGTETWPAASDPGDLLREDPGLQQSLYGTEAPSLLPGTALGGRYISVVEHRVAAGLVTTTVSWETSPTTEDRATRVERAIFDHFAARFDWFATYSAKVVSQGADGKLELRPDNPDIPGLTGVPIRYGIPGVRAKVLPGARVSVAFDAGDPGEPFATVWESGTLTELTITVGAGGIVNLGGPGGLAVALQGDTAGPWPVVTKGMVVKAPLVAT